MMDVIFSAPHAPEPVSFFNMSLDAIQVTKANFDGKAYRYMKEICMT